jgi:hypothetical protein
MVRLLMVFVLTVASNSTASASIRSRCEDFSVRPFQGENFRIRSATYSPTTPSHTPPIAQYSTDSQKEADAISAAIQADIEHIERHSRMQQIVVIMQAIALLALVFLRRHR